MEENFEIVDEIPILSNENLEIDPVDESSAPSTSRKRSRYRSPIWNYFTLDSSSPSKAICSICGSKYQHSNNTSNLVKVRYENYIIIMN